MEEVSFSQNLGLSREGRLKNLGIHSLYSFQEEAIKSVLSNHDSLVIAPTSGGKSMCYVVPSLVRDGLTLVISPLISLMRDQIRELREKGVPSTSLDSMRSPEEKQLTMKQVQEGQIKLLFVSPERLALPSFRSQLAKVEIGLVAIDEAHCVNQWGQDFRPEYAKISSYLKDFYKGPKIALTATATADDREKIIDLLNLDQPDVVLAENTRSNLKTKFFRAKNQGEHLNLLLQGVLSASGSGVVYCATRKLCEEITSMLRSAGLSASSYHAGLHPDRRELVYREFMSGDSTIIVATKAFGMGINKRDIRFVFHASLPESIEEYCQEIGRAGRDGDDARCYLFYVARDYHIKKYMIDKSFPKQGVIWAAYQLIEELFSFTQTVNEIELESQIKSSCGLNSDEVRQVLEFFFRENVLRRLELVRDSWSDQGIDVMVAINSKKQSLKSLCESLECRKEGKLSRLKSMYELAKTEESAESYITKYFS